MRDHALQFKIQQKARDLSGLQSSLRIKQLLYEEGFTIAGAKKRLEAELSVRADTPSSMAAAAAAGAAAADDGEEAAPDPTRAALREVREQLRDLLTLLDRNGRRKS